MRVVGGAWRGRRLTAPAGRATRPTSDLVREAIFDVLVALLASAPPPAGASPADAGPGPLSGMAILDLFAGSGLSASRRSRGAASCTFVERAPAALRVLRQNLARVSASAGAVRVSAADYRRALKADAAGARLYNLVLVDAPYALYPAVEPELSVRVPGVLCPGAVVVVETAKGQAVSLALVERSVKFYGDTRVTFLQARS